MKKDGVYGTDYGGECQHVLQQTPAAWLVLNNRRYSCSPSIKREVVMQYVEKDDPREAPESGDKKPQPVKK